MFVNTQLPCVISIHSELCSALLVVNYVFFVPVYMWYITVFLAAVAST